MRPAHSSFWEVKRLKAELIDKAKERVPSIPVLINMVSKRVRQLNSGFRPYVRPESPDEEKVDVALREIAEGKLIAEVEFTETAP
jgi:DNA-directed RNA polymerase subunit omega